MKYKIYLGGSPKVPRTHYCDSKTPVNFLAVRKVRESFSCWKLFIKKCKIWDWKPPFGRIWLQS